MIANLSSGCVTGAAPIWLRMPWGRFFLCRGQRPNQARNIQNTVDVFAVFGSVWRYGSGQISKCCPQCRLLGRLQNWHEIYFLR
jgi:hypothetical protein